MFCIKVFLASGVFLMNSWYPEQRGLILTVQIRGEKLSVIMLPYGFISLKPIFIKNVGYNPVKKSLNEDIWICDNSLQFPGNISGLLDILLCLQNLDQKLFIQLWKSLFPVHQIVPSYKQSKWKKYKKLLIINECSKTK